MGRPQQRPTRHGACYLLSFSSQLPTGKSTLFSFVYANTNVQLNFELSILACELLGVGFIAILTALGHFRAMLPLVLQLACYSSLVFARC